MTVHELHDALNLLPGDLITAVDKLRTKPKEQVIHWKRWVPLAACLVLVLSVTMVFARELMPGMGAGQKESAAAEAPAAAAPMAPMEEGPIAEVPAAESAQDIQGADSSGLTTDEKTAEEEICTEHSHRFAEESDRAVNSQAYCGNTSVTIDVDGEQFTISGSDAIAVTDILISLDYDPDAVCRCMAEFTVDTEMLIDIHVNLTQGYARCEKGQAALTEEQTKMLREIIEQLK